MSCGEQAEICLLSGSSRCAFFFLFLRTHSVPALFRHLAGLGGLFRFWSVAFCFWAVSSSRLVEQSSCCWRSFFVLTRYFMSYFLADGILQFAVLLFGRMCIVPVDWILMSAFVFFFK